MPPGTSIILRNDTIRINGAAFAEQRNLTSIIIPNNVTSIGNSAFYRSGLTSITIPDSVTSIGSSAFGYCTSLTSVTIPNSVTSIGDNTFLGVPIRNLNIDMTTIPNFQYNKSALRNLTIGNNVRSIAGSVFAGCTSLTSVVIPDNVTSIGDNLFSGCTNLNIVTIGSGIANIPSNTFNACEGLTTITFRSVTPPLFGSGVFTLEKTPNLSTIYVPVGSIEAYQAVGQLRVPGIPTIPILAATTTTQPPTTTTQPPTTTEPPTTTPLTSPTRPKGDVNGDGAVTITDALEILMYLAGMPSELDKPANFEAARMITGGEKPAITDALEILMYLAGLPSNINK
jgi:hypothetical protein